MIMIVLVFVKGPVCWFGQDQPSGPVKITQLAPFHFLGRDHCPTFNSKDVSWQDTLNFLIKNAATYAAAGWLVRSLVLEEEFRTLRNGNCYQLCLCTHNHNYHQHHQHWHPDIMKAVIEHCLWNRLRPSLGPALPILRLPNNVLVASCFLPLSSRSHGLLVMPGCQLHLRIAMSPTRPRGRKNSTRTSG